MWHDKNTMLKTFLLFHTDLLNYFICSGVLRHFRFYMVEQFQSWLVRIGSKQFMFFWSEKLFLYLKLLITYRQEKSCLPYWFTVLYMVIEVILSAKTFVAEWILTGYYKTSDYFFWLMFPVRSLLSSTTLRFPHSSLMNTYLVKSCF